MDGSMDRGGKEGQREGEMEEWRARGKVGMGK